MPETKMCNACQQHLPFDHFAKQARGLHGLKARCQDCLKAENHARYLANREARKAQARAWVDANRDRRRRNHNEWNRRNRLAAIEIHGGRCAQCGSTADLAFDHIEGGGRAHRKLESSHAYVRRIVKNGAPNPILQLLCPECHAKKSSREISEAGRRWRASQRDCVA